MTYAYLMALHGYNEGCQQREVLPSVSKESAPEMNLKRAADAL